MNNPSSHNKYEKNRELIKLTITGTMKGHLVDLINPRLKS